MPHSTTASTFESLGELRIGFFAYDKLCIHKPESLLPEKWILRLQHPRRTASLFHRLNYSGPFFKYLAKKSASNLWPLLFK
jgi:hypothetical protein